VALYGGTGDTVSTSNPGSPPAPGLRLLPLHRVDRNGDGVLDPTDEVWFWVRGTSIWKADSTVPGGWTFSIHPYGETRRYFLRLDAPQGSPGTGCFPRPDPAHGPSHRLAARLGRVPQPTAGLRTSGGFPLPIPARGRVGSGGTVPHSHLGPTQLAYPFNQSSRSVLRFGLVTVYTAGNCAFPREPWAAWASGWVQAYSTPFPEGRYTATFSVHGLSAGGNQYTLSNATGLLVSGYTVDYQRDVSKLDSAAFPTPSRVRFRCRWETRGPAGCWSTGRPCGRVRRREEALRDSATDPDTWYAVFGSNPGSVPVTLSLETPSIPGARDPGPDVGGQLRHGGGCPGRVPGPGGGIRRVAREFGADPAHEGGDPAGPGRVGSLGERGHGSGGVAQCPAVGEFAMGDLARAPVGRRACGSAARGGPVRRSSTCPQWEDDDIATDDFYTWFDTTGAAYPQPGLGQGAGA
jgi:hypothetical protein